MTKTAPNHEYHRNPWMTQMVTGARPVAMCRGGAARAAMRSSTAASAIALCALLGSTAAAATCVIDPAQGQIYIQTCIGSTGANGAIGPNGDGQNGGAGGVPESGGYGFSQNFPGIVGKPTVAFTGVGGRGGKGGPTAKSNSLQRAGDGGRGGDGWDFSLGLSGRVEDGGNALIPVSVLSGGGAGGEGGFHEENNYGFGGAGGDGGNGGSVGFTLETTGQVVSTGAGVSAVSLLSRGGAGGDAQSTATEIFTGAKGARGGAGGGAGAITANIFGVIRSAGAGLQVFSLAANGGEGGAATSTVNSATGGDGGTGGQSGLINLTLTGAAITATGTAKPATGVTQDAQKGKITFSAPVAAVQALTTGGIGGVGGSGDAQASKGKGGAGGTVSDSSTVTITALNNTLTTSGYGAAGILAQSAGGHGGNGGFGGGAFVSVGGAGAAGGNAGPVQVTSRGGSIQTTGDSSLALVGQSLGGGGGYGADASVTGPIVGVAVGGDSASGGNGGSVTIDNVSAGTSGPKGATIVTSGYKSTAILAQSIGGGGGIAGDARANVLGGFFSLGVGGTAGSGGDADSVSIANDGLLQTNGVGAFGAAAQSIGGGGGNGGAAASLVVGAQLTVASAVGGKGGTGGDGGVTIVAQTSQIITNGVDAIGVLAQSIGGGGGTGGTSVARNIQLFNAPQAPSVDLTLAIGGSGGRGGSSFGGTIINGGTVLTSGYGAIGLLGQSIGGGGGTGGDSNALSLLGKGGTVNVSTSIGGNAGSGGNAGKMEVDNSGLVGTIADHSSAVMAQSIGGGGGVGGYGNAASGSLSDNDASLTVVIGVGGKGGSGGKGSLVTVNNKPGGQIFTLGSASYGVFAQSVGGGGGNAGGALANGGGGTKVNLNVGVGGSGGSGNDGGPVVVTNDAAIVTLGGSASAIYAQSVGGGGGAGGDAALGTGASPGSSAADLAKRGLGIGTKTTTSPDGLVTQLDDIFDETKDINAELQKIVDAYKELNPSDPGKEKGTVLGQLDVNIGGGFGGKAGSGGNGLEITVTNSGSITTRGAFAEGIFGQSIGGGGGTGGAAAVTNDTSVVNGTLGIGGRGGSSGDGRLVMLTHTGSIRTLGDAAFGIYGQSVGGGGGKGGASVGKPGILSDFAVNIGGNGGSNGTGGPVTIHQDGAVVTSGRDAIGVIAQSVGGGGGLGLLMTINADNSGGSAASHTGYIINRDLLTFNINGANGGTKGSGGAVTVDVNGGGITTSGINAYGVLAQSIGGGGGLIIGVDGKSDKTSPEDIFVTGPFNGDGGTVDVTLSNGAQITTSGAGAVGVLAQTVGGGGALIGGMDKVDLTQPVKITSSALIDNKTPRHVGSGGDLAVQIDAGSSITTTGARAHGMFVQSNGNGGGIYSHADGSGFTFAGLSQFLCNSPGDQACTGFVTIDVAGNIYASGSGAYGIYAQSRGDGIERKTGIYPIDITMRRGGEVRSDAPGTAAIYIDSPNAKARITNDGFINGRSGTAIDGNGPIDLINSHWIAGSIGASGTSARFAITNLPTGRIFTGVNTMSVGTLINQGELWLGIGSTYNALITGGLNSTGRLITGIDFTNGKADTLTVLDTTTISGEILVQPLNIKPATVYFLAGKDLSVRTVTVSDFRYNEDDTLTPVTPVLYSYSLSKLGNVLGVAAKGNLSQPDGVLGANQDVLADHLQALFDASTSGGEAVLDALLRNVTVLEDYQPALESLGPDSLGSLALLQSQADRSFTGAMMSCDGNAAQQAKAGERNCLWMRGVYGDVDRGSTASDLGYNAAFSGFQIGGQHRISDDWLIGGSLAYQNSEIDADRSRATLDGDGFDAGIFIKREKGPLLLAAALTGGRQWYDTARLTNIGGLLATATASPDVSHIGWHARIAYELGGGNWHLRPQLDLDATRIHVGGFTEIGLPFALRVDGRNETQFSAAPALELGGDVPLNGRLTLRPFVRAGATFNAGNDWHFVASFASVEDVTQTFRSRTTLPNTVARLGAGFDLIGTRGVELKLQYDGEFGNRYAAQQGSVRLTYRF